MKRKIFQLVKINISLVKNQEGVEDVAACCLFPDSLALKLISALEFATAAIMNVC